MSVYVDAPRDYGALVNGHARRYGTRWSHLWADSEAELRAFVQRLGLAERWIQHAGTRRVHFDVTPPKRALAIELGAVQMEYREWLRERRTA